MEGVVVPRLYSVYVTHRTVVIIGGTEGVGERIPRVCNVISRMDIDETSHEYMSGPSASPGHHVDPSDVDLNLGPGRRKVRVLDLTTQGEEGHPVQDDSDTTKRVDSHRTQRPRCRSFTPDGTEREKSGCLGLFHRPTQLRD